MRATAAGLIETFARFSPHQSFTHPFESKGCGTRTRTSVAARAAITGNTLSVRRGEQSRLIACATYACLRALTTTPARMPMLLPVVESASSMGVLAGVLLNSILSATERKTTSPPLEQRSQAILPVLPAASQLQHRENADATARRHEAVRLSNERTDERVAYLRGPGVEPTFLASK
jgi:hypothetical protein